jgi:hypothetical protein
MAETWTARFGDLAPVAHLMRAALPDRWLRIHSLPDSKRYPESEPEYSELLGRHNKVASEILGENSEAILFAHAWGTSADFRSAFAEFGWARGLGLVDASTVILPPAGDGESSIVIGECSIRWSAQTWNTLLRDVAAWRTTSMVIYNPRSGEVYAPYDGGADIFVARTDRVAILKQKWSLWLSAHPGGL